MKKIVFLTGSGISAESGIPTFRMAADAMWENYDVQKVCTHRGWLMNSDYVNSFYNMLRVKYKDVKPNDAHKLIAELEKDYDVTVITQNVDDLHEKAGSTKVLHLHGEIMKCCSDENTENPEYWVTLPQEGFGESGYEIPEGQLSGDGGLLRPYVVFFEEPVPNMSKAEKIIEESDILVIIGTSLSVYPAAYLVRYRDVMHPLYIIDPNSDLTTDFIKESPEITHIVDVASNGMKKLLEIL